MVSVSQWIIPLAEAADCWEHLVGGKAAKLAHLRQAGFRVANGFCVTTLAYERFVAETGLAKYVAIELGRKSLDGMRWEEIWDVALRIRSEFLRAKIPDALSQAIGHALADQVGGIVAVRSSAPGEDSRQVSFAGLHESVVGVEGPDAVLDAVRSVWASLWSDAALLYRRELSLDPLCGRMAVLIQGLKVADCSGVAFGRDPRDPEADSAIVEAVPGQCALLVDGVVDPDRWVLKRSSGELVRWQPGDRGESNQKPLLEASDIEHLLDTIERVEHLFRWAPDVEWTGRSAAMFLLQARPITTTKPEAGDEREWYLSLRMGARRLKELADRVTEELIPKLELEGACFAAEDLERCDEHQLAAAIQDRLQSLRKWKKVYRDDFIPFAHGVRQFARYYNDTVRPNDPYEFVGLLRSQDMLASRRNRGLARLAMNLRHNLTMSRAVADALERVLESGEITSQEWLGPVRDCPGGSEFLDDLNALSAECLDITYGSERLLDRPDLILHTVLELSANSDQDVESDNKREVLDPADLEQSFLETVGPARAEEATEVLRIARLSWRLRDDDNLLLSRVESQLYRAVDLSVGRLRAAGRIHGEALRTEESIAAVLDALKDPSKATLELASPEELLSQSCGTSKEKPRQLVGQPAASGLATGKVRRITAADDLKRFRAGEVLVCDAIQPMMTHLVPLAAGIVERRGGMLIHGAIIARELQIPCVNGILRAVDLLEDGEIVTVDGHLGIVTVGPPEFDLELR